MSTPRVFVGRPSPRRATPSITGPALSVPPPAVVSPEVAAGATKRPGAPAPPPPRRQTTTTPVGSFGKGRGRRYRPSPSARDVLRSRQEHRLVPTAGVGASEPAYSGAESLAWIIGAFVVGRFVLGG